MDDMISNFCQVGDMGSLLSAINYKDWDKDWDDEEDEMCSFCGEKYSYRNQLVGESLILYACESCYQQIKDGEVDLIENSDPVSQKLNTIIREFIDEEYWYWMDAYDFNELELGPYNCEVCNEDLTKDIPLTDGYTTKYRQSDIQLNYVNDKFHILHSGCQIKLSGRLKGFWEEQDYQEIINHLTSEIEEALFPPEPQTSTLSTSQLPPIPKKF